MSFYSHSIGAHDEVCTSWRENCHIQDGKQTGEKNDLSSAVASSSAFLPVRNSSVVKWHTQTLPTKLTCCVVMPSLFRSDRWTQGITIGSNYNYKLTESCGQRKVHFLVPVIKHHCLYNHLGLKQFCTITSLSL